jgi:hypothetical protein
MSDLGGWLFILGLQWVRHLPDGSRTDIEGTLQSPLTSCRFPGVCLLTDFLAVTRFFFGQSFAYFLSRMTKMVGTLEWYRKDPLVHSQKWSLLLCSKSIVYWDAGNQSGFCKSSLSIMSYLFIETLINDWSDRGNTARVYDNCRWLWQQAGHWMHAHGWEGSQSKSFNLSEVVMGKCAFIIFTVMRGEQNCADLL